MYVAKFNRRGIVLTVTLLEKQWSEQMLSHEVSEICRKNFLLSSSGYNWINKQVCKIMFEKHELEIIDG